jgi:hypothetical protein
MNIFLPPPPHLPTFYHIPPLAYNEKSLFGNGKRGGEKSQKIRCLLIKSNIVQKGNGFEILLFLWSGISHHIKNPHFGEDFLYGGKGKR